jgi:menaquinone-9 beta-reductase
VSAGGGRTTFSFCVRRDTLSACRRRHARLPAGEAVLAHIASHCRGVREALNAAEREGAWLAAGPIRPGIRRFFCDGVFVIGNAAGEAHPVIAEGIGMAMQSASLLSGLLKQRAEALSSARAAREVALAYEREWRTRSRLRMTAARLFAAVAMRPGAARWSERILREAPSLLSLCARFSGKSV